MTPENIFSRPATAPKFSEFRRIAKTFLGHKLGVVGLFFLLLCIVSAIFAPWLSPHNPYEMNLDNQLQQPSKTHLLGTDNLGRDTLSRIIYGARTSLIVGVGAVGAASVVGFAMGLAAGHYGGWVFVIIMRLTDTLMSIPMLILALLIASLLGGGIHNVIIALCVGSIGGKARMMCGLAQTVRENDYVLAERAIGVNDWRIMLRHILPNCFPPLLVMISMSMGMVILGEASLSFLGIGILPPTCAWGSMVNDGYKYLLTNPLVSVAPGVAIMLVVFGFNMVGDGLRDSLDPRLRGTI